MPKATKSLKTLVRKPQIFAARPRNGYIKIGVSGAALGESVAKSAKKAEIVGREIAKHKCVLVTGATIGLPLYAAKGADLAGGISIGFSPAATELEHVRSYRLPTKYMDMIIYTGFNYSGRNLILTRAADAVIHIGGRIGTLNEFTIAFEDHKVLGVLTGSGGISDELDRILTVTKRGRKNIIFDEDPVRLVKKVIALVKQVKQGKVETGRPHNVRSRVHDQ
jgi:uncharacterized protein (TIGR00725 family)